MSASSLRRRLAKLEKASTHSRGDATFSIASRALVSGREQPREVRIERLKRLLTLRQDEQAPWEAPPWWTEPVPDTNRSSINAWRLHALEAVILEHELNPEPGIRWPKSTDPGFDFRNPGAHPARTPEELESIRRYHAFYLEVRR